MNRRERTAAPLFSRPEFRRVAGEALRPGGLDLTRRALALAGLPGEALVADLGCGPGATSRLLAEAGHRVLALDPDTPAGAAPPGVSFLRARAEALPLPDARLDAAFCECVLSVTGAHAAVLAEAARVLKPGGLLVLSDLYLRAGGAFPGHAGDCLSGAPPLPVLEDGLLGAGFAIEVFEDHSRLLAGLAGALVFAGLPTGELCGRGGGRPGYFLCLARRTDNQRRSHARRHPA